MTPEDSQWLCRELGYVPKEAAGEFSAKQPTLRDQFAIAALGGLLGFPHHEGFQFPPPSHSQPADVASLAYAFADAMLAARETKPEAP